MEIFFIYSEATWFRVHGLFSVTGSVGVEPRILILSPLVTARMGLQRSEKMYQGIERCKKEELVLEKQAKCGDWARRNQHCRSD